MYSLVVKNEQVLNEKTLQMFNYKTLPVIHT